MKKTSIIPFPVQNALRKLGTDIREARIKRRITMALLAERAGITPVTLARVERGEATVSIGIYAKVFCGMGLIRNLSNLIDPDNDPVGKIYTTENLPKRVRHKKD